MNKKSLGARILNVRTMLGLTQGEFVKQLDITQGFLSKIEKGEAKPTRVLLMAISHSYGINLDWLLTGEGDMLSLGEPHPTTPALDKNERRLLDAYRCLSPEQRRHLLVLVEHACLGFTISLKNDDAESGSPGKKSA